MSALATAGPEIAALMYIVPVAEPHVPPEEVTVNDCGAGAGPFCTDEKASELVDREKSAGTLLPSLPEPPPPHAAMARHAKAATKRPTKRSIL